VELWEDWRIIGVGFEGYGCDEIAKELSK